MTVLRLERERIGAGKRRTAAEELPQRRSERVEVGGRSGRDARGLLRRLVVRRAGTGDQGADRLVDGHRDAEVAQAGAAVRGEPDVVWLDVAVHDAVLVGVRERIRERASGANHLVHGQPAAGHRREPFGERPARHVAGDDVQHVAVLYRVVDGDDVRVVAESRRQPRLAPHPLARLGAGRAGPGA